MERSRVVLPATALIVALLTAGCFTGKRAIIVPETAPSTTVAPDSSDAVPSGTGPAALLEAVALRLGRPATGPETANYKVRPTFQGTPVDIVVSRDSARTLVSVRDIEFRITATGSHTCRRATRRCTPGLDAQPLSDLLISATFWGPAARQALRSPGMVARASAAKASSIVIPGTTLRADCVTVPGNTLDERFCVTPSGLLALQNTARVDITLTTYSTSFAQVLWDEFTP